MTGLNGPADGEEGAVRAVRTIGCKGEDTRATAKLTVAWAGKVHVGAQRALEARGAEARQRCGAMRHETVHRAVAIRVAPAVLNALF